MTIKSIVEIKNTTFPNQAPVKEKMDIYVPKITAENIPKRNGSIYVLCGSGGSGKTSLMLNMFKTKLLYRKKFHNIYYICPTTSFLSVEKHPFQDHENVYHELTYSVLEDIYNELIELKEKEKKPVYSLIIIDDYADAMKDSSILKILSRMIIKARHINCCFFFTLQSYYYFPKILRKQITYITLFKPKNIEEFYSIAKELFNMNQDDALKLYDYVFDANYNHLDIDTVTNKYYKNFNLLNIEN
jgi:GTPase SAR1 family protein